MAFLSPVSGRSISPVVTGPRGPFSALKLKMIPRAYKMIITPATPRLSASTSRLPSSPIELLKRDGMSNATIARASRMALRLAWRRSKVCMPLRSPPITIDIPSTRSKLPKIDPVIDALTKSSRPSQPHCPGWHSAAHQFLVRCRQRAILWLHRCTLP